MHIPFKVVDQFRKRQPHRSTLSNLLDLSTTRMGLKKGEFLGTLYCESGALG